MPNSRHPSKRCVATWVHWKIRDRLYAMARARKMSAAKLLEHLYLEALAKARRSSKPKSRSKK